MNKSGVIITSIIVTVFFILALGFFLSARQSEELPPPETPQRNSGAINLGFTYLPVTPRVSAYYNLGVDSGAFVTNVIPRSPAAAAGIEVGDVVLSFNGTRVDGEASLLGMMMACRADHRIVLEVWRSENVTTVELIHRE